MSQPKIAARTPMVIELDPGEYWWCRCGYSLNQPFCDGHHSGTGLEPMKVTLADKKRVALCQCKHTANEPYCDGRHKQLPQ